MIQFLSRRAHGVWTPALFIFHDWARKRTAVHKFKNETGTYPGITRKNMNSRTTPHIRTGNLVRGTWFDFGIFGNAKHSRVGFNTLVTKRINMFRFWGCCFVCWKHTGANHTLTTLNYCQCSITVYSVRSNWVFRVHGDSYNLLTILYYRHQMICNDKTRTAGS